jgi:hypothetical protein
MTERNDTDPTDSPGAADSTDEPTESDDVIATEKADGIGQDGTIPSDPSGVAAGHTGTESTFEPEEDEQA